MRLCKKKKKNDRCRDAISAKLAAKGTDKEIAERDLCSTVLREEYDAHIAKTKAHLSSLPVSSKKWWKLSNALQGKSRANSTVQPLQRPDKSWARSATERAELLADTFQHKSALPTEFENDYSDLGQASVGADVFLPVRTRTVERTLKKLKVDSATGPDGIATVVLKRCSAELARPVAMLIRKLLDHGVWPSAWRFHRIVPLFKRKARSEPGNYRGVHLTNQISKVVERVVGKLFLGKLERDGAFGERQFAYSVGKGH